MRHLPRASSTPNQIEIPIQPVAKPILCSPFAEPDRHWVYDTQTGDARQETGRRPASYWYKTQRTGSAQLALLAEEERDDLPLVNLLREDVKRWREANYRNATPVTRQLLAHWSRADRPRRLFFCQREAVETVIYLNEILAAGKNPGFKPKLSPDDFHALTEGGKPSFVREREPKVFPTLMDQPNEAGLPPLRRYGCKMATGSGKTVVMAMLIAWAFCNRGRAAGGYRLSCRRVVSDQPMHRPASGAEPELATPPPIGYAVLCAHSMATDIGDNMSRLIVFGLILLAGPAFGQMPPPMVPVDDVSKLANPANRTIEKDHRTKNLVPEKTPSGMTVYREAPDKPQSSKPVAPALARPPETINLPKEQMKVLADSCFELFRKSFFDPYSVVREGERAIKMPDGGTAVVLELNAKNRMGAYVGIKQFYCLQTPSGEIRVGQGDLPH